ncbi:TPA: hypothetical protein ML354_001766 [Salmonella enterica]|nr:hypothetical protein [Salmonella enterica subsp. enterica serovar Llandoff]ECG5099886.1 hypothetical protein [Salmonella enterica subsp. enterica]EDX4816581.1 hypothetical protein [Salmonella enterica subsp. enterica]EHA4611342.1 hypothetical protein [Salmonella enterica]HBZ6169082.1 hypothetical protein [Salmonella enterica]
MAEPILNRNGWEGSFKDWLVIDTAIREENIICFLLRKKIDLTEASQIWDHDIPTRIVTFSLLRARDGNQRSHQELTGFNIPVLGIDRINSHQPLGLVAAKNLDGDVWKTGRNLSGPMEQIAKGQSPFTNRLKCINGYTYAVCSGRKIYKRIQSGKWELFATLPELSEQQYTMGFDDLDAFSENDMYAVGGCGDIWHYDGANWKQQGFPTNAQLATVTCAPDGQVYVSGEGGSLWVGRSESWKKIYSGSSSVLWNDAIWFEGKLWLASDYQLRVWDGKELGIVENNGKPVSARGHMDAYDGLLVVAGPEFVYSFDGTSWRLLVAPYLD